MHFLTAEVLAPDGLVEAHGAVARAVQAVHATPCRVPSSKGTPFAPTGDRPG